eukprot:TRINITY_DN847_c0_g1_i4.p1 TRINITY_DN847_c0_g1~~TRINITY_DN847_c0_g1_i4.p1  ORF type:complete len:210 (+),score=80.03 TRINITY_DN847_c0_g1_i4:889-1518(+)
MRSENDKHINKQVGTVASYPDFGFIVKYHQSGHLRKILMEDKKKYTEKELVKIALDVSEGINALHRLKLLARIVESRNVVIEGSGKDITALFDPDWEPECLTNEKEGSQNVYLGPVAWMAPEIIEDRKFTERSDVYSFGVFLVELFSSKDPYPERSAVGIACPVIHKGLRPAIPKGPLESIITQCIEVAENRISMKDATAELAKVYQSM